MNVSEFLDLLAVNNNREWFREHKSLYDDVREHWYGQLDRLIASISSWDARVIGLTGRQISYRIYRDTRFSLDKTPYKTHFSACINPSRRRGADLYVQVGTTEAGGVLGGGLWAPDAREIKKLRHAIVDNIEEFEEIVNAPDVVRLFPGWYGPQLKTAPKGWDRNHPHIGLLRLQWYCKCHNVDTRFFHDPDWPEKASDMLRVLKPLDDFLEYSLYEDE